MFELLHLACGFIAPHLFIERIEQLLTRRCSGKGSAMVKCPAKTTEVEQAFGSAIERHAHAIEQINNGRRCLAHRSNRRLVGEEVAAVNGVIEMLPGGIALAFEIFGSVNAA